MAWLLPGRIPLSMAPAASSGTAILAAVHETPASTPSTSHARWDPRVPRISRQPARRVSRSRSTGSPSRSHPATAMCARIQVRGYQARPPVPTAIDWPHGIDASGSSREVGARRGDRGRTRLLVDRVRFAAVHASGGGGGGHSAGAGRDRAAADARGRRRDHPPGHLGVGNARRRAGDVGARLVPARAAGRSPDAQLDRRLGHEHAPGSLPDVRGLAGRRLLAVPPVSSSTFGYTVHAVIAALTIAWGAFAHLRRPRFATLDDVVTRLMRNPVARWAEWALWSFIGWHLFVRGSGAFN